MRIERNFEDNEFLKEISIEEFQNSGMLWFVNSLLHNFGLCIAYEPDEERLFPAITKFRGFDEKNNDLGYKRLATYMVDNAEEFLKDCE